MSTGDSDTKVPGGMGRLALLARARRPFDKSERNELLGILADKKLGISARDKRSHALLDALEIEIGRFELLKETTKNQPTNVAVQEQFEQLPQETRVFQEALERMYPEMRSLVKFTLFEVKRGLILPSTALAGEADQASPRATLDALVALQKAAEDFLGNLTKDLQIFHSALLMAQEVYESDPDNSKRPSHGRRYTLHLMLATHVAWAYYKHLGKVPKKTRKGPFYSILRICLQAAGFYREDYFDVMKEAIDSMSEV